MSQWKIPKMDDPQGKGWQQPANIREVAELFDTHVRIPTNVFFNLPNYETSFPSGVYPGKVWRSGRKFIRWWGPERNGKRKACLCRVLLT